ncbi:MAG: hypothetical protein HC874_29995 [Richelia sp. SL_2_1]|nr:hypothetical protein [Richelia sp. SL_2_1]
MQDNIAKQLSLNLSIEQKASVQIEPKVVTMPDGKPLPDGEVILYQSFLMK